MAGKHEMLSKSKNVNKIDSFNQYHFKIRKLQFCEVIIIIDR